MIRFEKLCMPAASMGEPNPLPDIKNVSYIHAGYELTDKVQAEERTYIGKGMIPTMLPYMMQDGYDRNKKPREFEAAILENEHLKVTFLPELGGRLWSIFDKDKGKELLYVNPVFQPGNLGLRNAWFSGGVEFNVGIKGHNPLTCAPLWCAVDRTDQGEILRLYEYERIRGVVYSISAFLPEDSPVLLLKCCIENKSATPKHMYWWSNIAVPETKETRVLVPADDSFLCFYNADHYVLDKTSIPISNDIDASYPTSIPSSRDFFYKIPPQHRKWIATANEDGFGLLQCSTRKLLGRKLFVWGMGQGGRHWNSWLSEEGSAYIEIQAGLAHTQLEHIPMAENTTWEWVEAYTALDRPADIIHGNYNAAVSDVEKYIDERIGNPDQLPFPNDEEIRSSRIIFRGSDWGAVEEMLRREPLSTLCRFPKQETDETAAWTELLQNGSFPAPSVTQTPASYVSGKEWAARLDALEEQSWFSLLHLGVIHYAEGDLKGAQKAWEDSLEKERSPWALRNLAMLYKNELGQPEAALPLIKAAWELKPDCLPLTRELAAMLTELRKEQEWLTIYKSLPLSFQNNGRLRLYKAISLMQLERLEEAAEIINERFEMSDIKEGELSVSHYWFALYRRIYAREMGLSYDESDVGLAAAADKKYPLPRALDFRMHD